MRKLSKIRSQEQDLYPPVDDCLNERPRCIPGSTITSWRGTPNVDLDALFAGSAGKATVTGAAPANIKNPASVKNKHPETVSLSDGTRITFASPDQFEAVATV